MTKSVTQRNEKKKKETGFLEMFWGTLHVSFSVIMLADKTARATGQGWKKNQQRNNHIRAEFSIPPCLLTNFKIQNIVKMKSKLKVLH